MGESILVSIKKIIGLSEDYECFDPDIIIAINSVFLTLKQIGVGPEDEIFEITGKEETWDEFFKDSKKINAVKQYVGIKVRTIFDPPNNSFLLEALNKTADELLWRMNIEVDPEKENQNV